MKDKNNITLGAGAICLTYDRFGGAWVAPLRYEYIQWMKGGKAELVFDSNYSTVLHKEYSKEYEIIGNIADNPWLLLIHCNSIVYAVKRLIWNIKMARRIKSIKYFSLIDIAFGIKYAKDIVRSIEFYICPGFKKLKGEDTELNGIPILNDKQYVLDNEVWLVGDNRKVIKRYKFNK